MSWNKIMVQWHKYSIIYMKSLVIQHVACACPLTSCIAIKLFEKNNNKSLPCRKSGETDRVCRRITQWMSNSQSILLHPLEWRAQWFTHICSDVITFSTLTTNQRQETRVRFWQTRKCTNSYPQKVVPCPAWLLPCWRK